MIIPVAPDLSKLWLSGLEVFPRWFSFQTNLPDLWFSYLESYDTVPVPVTGTHYNTVYDYWITPNQATGETSSSLYSLVSSLSQWKDLYIETSRTATRNIFGVDFTEPNMIWAAPYTDDPQDVYLITSNGSAVCESAICDFELLNARTPTFYYDGVSIYFNGIGYIDFEVNTASGYAVVERNDINTYETIWAVSQDTTEEIPIHPISRRGNATLPVFNASKFIGKRAGADTSTESIRLSVNGEDVILRKVNLNTSLERFCILYGLPITTKFDDYPKTFTFRNNIPSVRPDKYRFNIAVGLGLNLVDESWLSYDNNTLSVGQSSVVVNSIPQYNLIVDKLASFNSSGDCFNPYQSGVNEIFESGVRREDLVSTDQTINTKSTDAYIISWLPSYSVSSGTLTINKGSPYRHLETKGKFKVLACSDVVSSTLMTKPTNLGFKWSKHSYNYSTHESTSWV